MRDCGARVSGAGGLRRFGDIDIRACVSAEVSQEEPEGGSGLNDRQRRFCELLVSGLAAGRAYEQAGYQTSSAASADQCASRMLRNVKEVKEHVAKLRRELMAKTALSQEEVAGLLSLAILTPISEITEDHPLCQEWEREETEGAALSVEMQPSLFEGKEDVAAVRAVPVKTVKVKMLSKADALRMYIAMMGFNKPIQTEGEVTITLNKVW
jgi:phage terminase small subunit